MRGKPTKRTEKRRIGDVGEGIAAKYLESKGFVIKDQNYLRAWGEIDLVAEKDTRLHFIEVKTVRDKASYRDSNSYRPEENVHLWKLKRLSRVIETYLAEKGGESDWQLDLVVVYLDEEKRKARIDYLPSIF